MQEPSPSRKNLLSELSAHRSFLLAAAVDDGGLDGRDDSSGVVTGLLESENGLQGLLVSNLAEDDVLAIEPAGDDGGDEELRAVAGENKVRLSNRMEGQSKTYVLAPALAMDRRPGRVCFFWKFSSGNLSP